ncbi:helix-turn-helix domain-containing protein [Enterovirga rhinocerotis]|uniref:XRE family transcriptional regulator n=1 Tax=Enterovirga rhinocerotis TaxID=1339210 RepID=A0A4R7C0B7_9HYPH|nr:XRE family transcriptional regulator [Enterovirga rhinocerotis]TDR89816.1 XRE family transcriptional regulator [Enterovirga rhinocerotis]
MSGTIGPEHAALEPGADDGDERRLGMRLKARRLECRLSLNRLAELSGLSVGMLSQIERGISSPSLRSLRLLAGALGVPMSWFFAEPEEAERRESRHVVRRAERRLLRLTPTGVMKELLSPSSPDLFEMYELALQPGGRSGADFYSHLGEKAGIVLSGRLRLWLDGEEHLLDEGDSFHFPSKVPHQFDNPGPDVARIVWVMAPPMAGRPSV